LFLGFANELSLTHVHLFAIYINHFLAIESLEGQHHRTIFPGAHRMQSDVETIHNLMELEFYEIESFTNRLNFMQKAACYQLFFNLHRPNSYKEHKTPWQLAQEKIHISINAY